MSPMHRHAAGLILCFIAAVFFAAVLSAPTNASDVYEMLEKCDVAPNPVPALTVSNYETDPEIFITGDTGILQITLENSQEDTIEKKINLYVHANNTSSVETTTRYSMNALIREAYIVERDFKVYNRYSSAEVVGPGGETTLTFKIKAPERAGIYMLKFVADVENADDGGCGRDVRYWIPVVVCENPLRILPSHVSSEIVEVEVVNSGACDAGAVLIEVVNAENIEISEQNKTVYLGNIPAGKTKNAKFSLRANEGSGESGGSGGRVCFKATFRNGINRHQTDNFCVNIPQHPSESISKSVTHRSAAVNSDPYDTMNADRCDVNAAQHNTTFSMTDAIKLLIRFLIAMR